MEDIITENLRGFEIKFITKPGIFSKHGLDDGTRLLIDNLEVKDNTQIADLGSGTGVLGFVCAKLNPNGHIHLLDDHLRSVELAKRNIELNDLRNVEVYLSDLFSAVDNRTYHQIISNPPQSMGNEFLKEIISESVKHLKQDGELWLVIKNNIKNIMEKLLAEYTVDYRVVARAREHLVLKAVK